MSRSLRRLRAGAAAAAIAAAVLTPATSAHADATHVANPFVGATQYLSPDYTAEVAAQAAADGGSLGAAESSVANNPTAVWMDHIGAITGDTVHHGLQWHLDQALAQQTPGTPIVFNVVIYDLPGRDCAALASNGEIPATADGLTEYETQYIDPIAAILSNSKYSGIRIAAVIEPDSLPNAVTNQSKTACATATPYYEAGVEYALNKLHAIPNVYNYVDIGHSGWLGWSSNLGPAAQEFAKVAKATTAGVASVDGFISNTANYTPVTEPFLPNSTLQVGGQPLDSATFYQWNPMFDESTYDNAMYSQLVSQGFPSSIGMLIDTSRDGWGGPNRPTALNSSPTTPDTYVAANKIDQRPFRGDWCNQNGAGIGARPTAQPFGASSHIIAFVWIKPPGESDGDYPTATHTHGDPHCDPAGTNTDGNGGTYSTGSFPGYDIPAGQWFGAEFRQLVQNAYPSFGGSTGGDTTPPSTPAGLTVSATTASSVSLTWTASTDNVGVTAYDVYRGSTLAGSTAGTSFTDTGLTASTAYTYTVKARDAAGNVSPASTAVTATTQTGSSGTTTCSPTGTIAAGDYTIQANEWNSTAQQCVTYTGGTAWSVSTANFNLTASGAPATYPSIYKGCHWGACTANSGLPIQVSNLGSATSSWSTTQPASGAYDVAYDLWFNSTPTTTGQPDGTEVMIWLNSRGGVKPFGSQSGTANVAGANWNVWTGQQTSWKIISYVLNPGGTSVSNLDIKALINDAVSRGSINPAHYLIDAEAGFEIWQGGQGLATNSFSFNATTGGNTGDTTPPSVPANLAVTGTTSSSATLSWSPSTDNVGVAGYRVYRGGVQVGTATGTTFTDTGLSASTAYSYTVAAYDAAGNVSAQSAPVTATTQSGGGGTGGCTAAYSVGSQWSNGFTANVVVTNTGTAATKGWKVTWTWGGNQQITNIWNAAESHSGQSETATNMSYNGVIAPGANTSFGFQAGYSGTNTAPTLTCTAS